MLLFTSLGIAIAINVLADPLAGLLDRLAFSRSPDLRADRAALRRTEAALPLRSDNPLDGVDDDTFARLTRRALGHYGDLSKLVASPLTALPIDRRAPRRARRARPAAGAGQRTQGPAGRPHRRLKPRDGGDFGTTEQWRHYNSLYFPYVVGVRAYAQNATAAGLDPVARQAMAVVRHRGAAAVAAQLAERRGPADRRRSARQSRRRTRLQIRPLTLRRLAAAGSVWRRSGSGI